MPTASILARWLVLTAPPWGQLQLLMRMELQFEDPQEKEISESFGGDAVE